MPEEEQVQEVPTGKCPFLALFPQCMREQCNFWIEQENEQFSQCSFLMANLAQMSSHAILAGFGQQMEILNTLVKSNMVSQEPPKTEEPPKKEKKKNG